MATTPATPSNAGATTAAQWKDAAVSAKEAARQASVAQLEARDALKYSNGKISDANAILNDPNSSSAEKAQAQASLKENTASQTQAQIALDTATQQRATAISSAKQAESEAAKNTDPQAASTAAPASTTPNQPATAYTVTPPDSPAATSSTQNVTSANDPSLNSNTGFTEPTKGTTNVVENTTGGGSTTITRGAIVDTPASLAAKEQRNAADQKINAYSLDPNDPTERQFLDSNLQNGVITQQQYDENLTLTADQRQAKVNQAYAESAAASKTIAQTQTMGPDIVTRQENPNTTTTTVTDIQPKAADSTVLSGEVSGTNVSTANIGGTTYQTVSNADGTTSYTNEVTGTSNTINDASASDKKSITSDSNIVQAAAASDNAPKEQRTPITETPAATVPDDTPKEQRTPITETPAAAPAAAIVPKGQKLITEDSAQLAQEAAVAADAEFAAIEAANNNANTNRGTTSALANAQSQASQQDITNFNAKEDWRVKLSLAPNANYLYKVAAGKAGILNPLQTTKGIIFPYTPAISVAYAAQYDPTTLTHTNYKYFTYNSSSVDQITLSCDFTAQDVFEANYLLAVIHFFRSVTKMFYGQDQDPKPGTPPPLCYLTGLGAFQFDNHPIAITNFTYSLPTDVDYIRADNTSTAQTKVNTYSAKINRLGNNNLQSGAGYAPPVWTGAYVVQEPTYVPTKIQISITAVPIVTRNDISNSFSFDRYATGALLRGSERSSGGIW